MSVQVCIPECAKALAMYAGVLAMRDCLEHMLLHIFQCSSHFGINQNDGPRRLFAFLLNVNIQDDYMKTKCKAKILISHACEFYMAIEHEEKERELCAQIITITTKKYCITMSTPDVEESINK